MVVSRLLGLRLEFGNVVIDPVIPDSMDGMSASFDLLGRHLTLKYKVSESNFSPKTIAINGNIITFTYQENKYRKGGAVIPVEQFLALLNQTENSVEINL
jgi:cellobiose phosphorylase